MSINQFLLPPCSTDHNLKSLKLIGFLRRRQKKEKKKKSGDDDGGDSQKEMGSEGEDIRKSGTPTPDVDEDGFSKQPDTTGSSDPWSDFNHPSKSFYSSSDESGEHRTDNSSLNAYCIPSEL